MEMTARLGFALFTAFGGYFYPPNGRGPAG
jgi:hypothetical protein